MADSKVRFGLSAAYYAVLKDGGTYDTPVRMVGAQSIDVSNSGSDSDSLYGDDIVMYTANNGSSGKTLEVQFSKIGRDFLKNVCGMTEDPETGIVSESPDDTGRSFAFGFQTTGDAGGMRTWVLENTATVPVHSPGTNTDSLTEDPDSATFTSKPHECADGKRRLSCFCETGDAGYANFFAKVPFQVAATE